jgi:hypothetical protein
LARAVNVPLFLKSAGARKNERWIDVQYPGNDGDIRRTFLRVRQAKMSIHSGPLIPKTVDQNRRPSIPSRSLSFNRKASRPMRLATQDEFLSAPSKTPGSFLPGVGLDRR